MRERERDREREEQASPVENRAVRPRKGGRMGPAPQGPPRAIIHIHTRETQPKEDEGDAGKVPELGAPLLSLHLREERERRYKFLTLGSFLAARALKKKDRAYY